MSIRVPAVHANALLTSQANQQQLLAAVHLAAIAVLLGQHPFDRFVQLIHQVEPDQPVLLNVSPTVRAGALLPQPPVDALLAERLRTFHADQTLAKALETDATFQQDRELGLIRLVVLSSPGGHSYSLRRSVAVAARTSGKDWELFWILNFWSRLRTHSRGFATVAKNFCLLWFSRSAKTKIAVERAKSSRTATRTDVVVALRFEVCVLRFSIGKK